LRKPDINPRLFHGLISAGRNYPHQHAYPVNVKKEAIGFDATGLIKRSDFKLDKYVPAVSDNVTITLSTEAYAK
jgi:polyisoprenoid-binding protein YceI